MCKENKIKNINNHLNIRNDQKALADRIAPLREAVKGIGEHNSHFDMKAFSDDLYEKDSEPLPAGTDSIPFGMVF